MPPKKKQSKKTTQSQKQKQTQRVVINIASQRRKPRRKPRTTTRPNVSRVLQQFVQPEPMIPQRVIVPSLPPPAPFGQPVQSPILVNETASRPPAVKTSALRGRSPLEPPMLTPAQLSSVSAAKAVAREEDRKLKERIERSQEAERGLMAAADAESFMTQEAMGIPAGFRTPAPMTELVEPPSSPRSDPFPSSLSERAERFAQSLPEQDIQGYIESARRRLDAMERSTSVPFTARKLFSKE